MTKEELAARLNGRAYGAEISLAECGLAKESGLVVVFGYSDDNAEFRGVFDDEITAWEGIVIHVTRTGLLQRHDDCECPYCGFEAQKAKAAEVIAVWGRGGYAWIYQTKVPHATFDILETGEKFCRGIVLSINDLPE
jgi:hypothetical protein